MYDRSILKSINSGKYPYEPLYSIPYAPIQNNIEMFETGIKYFRENEERERQK